MTARLEHANLTVRNMDATARFLQTAFPEFRMRFDGVDFNAETQMRKGACSTAVIVSACSEGEHDDHRDYELEGEADGPP